MARTNLPLLKLAGNAAALNNAGTAIDQANGMTIALASGAIPAQSGADRLILYVQNTAGSTKTVTVKAGGNTTNDPSSPAFLAGKGDLVTGNLSATTGTAFIGPFEAARFCQSDGSVSIDFSSGATGTIWAVLLPKYFA
jgi:hypothetical protein